MTLQSLAKKLRTALIGSTFAVAGVGMMSTDGCDELANAAAAGFVIGQTLADSGALDGAWDGGGWDDSSWSDGSGDQGAWDGSAGDGPEFDAHGPHGGDGSGFSDQLF